MPRLTPSWAMLDYVAIVFSVLSVAFAVAALVFAARAAFWRRKAEKIEAFLAAEAMRKDFPPGTKIERVA